MQRLIRVLAQLFASALIGAVAISVLPPTSPAFFFVGTLGFLAGASIEWIEMILRSYYKHEVPHDAS